MRSAIVAFGIIFFFSLAPAHGFDPRRPPTWNRWLAASWPAASPAETRAANANSGVSSVDFSPDIKTLILKYQDGASRVWDIATAKELRLFPGRNAIISPVTFSPGRKRAIVIGADGLATLWDTAAGKKLFNLTPNATSAAFSADGKSVCIGSTDKNAYVWNVVTGQLIQQLTGHNAPVLGVGMSPDGKFAITGSEDNTAKLWDVAKAKLIKDFISEKGPVTAVYYHGDGKMILAGLNDGTTRLWEIETGVPYKDFALPAMYSGVPVHVSYAVEQPWIFMRNSNNFGVMWDINTAKTINLYNAMGTPVASVAVSGDASLIVTAADKLAFTWDAATGKLTNKIDGHGEKINSVVVSDDASMILTASLDATTWVWNPKTAHEIRRLSGTETPYSAVALSPDKNMALTGATTGTSFIWDLPTNTPKLEFSTSSRVLPNGKRQGSMVTSAAFINGGKNVAICDAGTGVSIWDIQKKSRLQLGKGASVAASADGKKLLVAGAAGVDILNAVTGVSEKKLAGAKVTCAAISTDNKYVVAGGGNLVYVWDLTSGNLVGTLGGHTSAINSIVCVPNSTLFLSASADATTRLWDAAKLKELCTLISYGDSWAVVDIEGRYDSANFGDTKELFGVSNVSVNDIRLLKERYFDPGLLSKYLGANKEPLKSLNPVATVPATTPATKKSN